MCTQRLREHCVTQNKMETPLMATVSKGIGKNSRSHVLQAFSTLFNMCHFINDIVKGVALVNIR